jgi:hypothetical protein
VRLNVSIPEDGIQDSNDVFKNGWSVLVMRKIPSAVQGDFSQLPGSFATDGKIWKHGFLGAFVLMECHVTGMMLSLGPHTIALTNIDSVGSDVYIYRINYHANQ